MVENAAAMEKVIRRELSQLDSSVAHTLRGRGLFFAVLITPTPGQREPQTEEREERESE